MATKKSKSSVKSAKTKSAKTNSAPKSVAKTELEATTKTNSVSTKPVTAKSSFKSCLAGFFAKKYDENESILTIFKNPRFYGALLGELIGTLLVAALLFALSLMGIANIAIYIFAIIAIYIGVYAFSRACLNPIIVAGMMASRRMSVIRGVMYIIAEILGAWLAWLIFNGFQATAGETAMVTMPAMAAVAEGTFGLVTVIELIGAIIVSFFFARALAYKRSVFTFAAVVAGGIALAVVVGYVASAFVSLSNNFIYNPAVAMMMKIFPTAGDNFGEILGGICQALAIYVVCPMVGGVLGFYLSDFAAKLSCEE